LRTRDRFAAEIRADLATSFDDGTCRAVIDRLIQRGLVDDVRLIRTLIEANRGKKSVSIEELRRRCTERGACANALELLADADEPSLEVLLQRFEHTARGRARAYRFLASRGFSEDDIVAALGLYMRESSAE